MEKKEMQIKDFIQETMKEIESAINEKYSIEGSVDFELEVGITKTKKNGLNLKVVELGTEKNKDSIQRVNFSIRSKTDPQLQLQQTINSKLNTFLSQPVEKIIDDLNKLPKQEEKRLIENTH